MAKRKENMEIFDYEQTTSALPFSKMLTAIEKMFVSGCHVPLRHIHPIVDDKNHQDGILLLMPSWLPQKWMAVKTVSIFPNNNIRGLPGLHSVVILYDAQTGKPVAVLDGDAITSRRTAAASALAARWLSRENSRTLLVLGAGRVGALLPEAYRCVRPIEKVYVWNPSRNKAESMVSLLQRQGFQALVADDLAAACANADIISCATLSTEPLILREWLKPGTHLDLIGSFTPAMRESDNACFDGTSVFVDTEEALIKAGDILSPIQAGVLKKEDIRATLYDLCRGIHPGREDADEITVYKAVGTALEDLASAVLAYAPQDI